MNIFEILAILFVVWVFTFLVNIRGAINLFSFLLIADSARIDFLVRKMSELNGFVSHKSKITQNLFFNGVLYLEDEIVSKTFFGFGVASIVLPLIMYFILEMSFFQIIFIISFVFFFFNILFYRAGDKELNRFEKDEEIKIVAEKIIRRYIPKKEN